ncbi:MAG: hypothetical protein PHX77_08055 [Candidatus Bipolaricaulis sp.]|nr:hypothetical protein [Candidatus Bipolaricaulis sp.]MDD5645769.1 hypothetical protein [Candidatus Bipolaricaulis sp.]
MPFVQGGEATQVFRAGTKMLIATARETATTAKIMVLILWHAIRYPHAASVVDYEARTVRLIDGDE